MNNFILRVGCFLTGRNYSIVKNCSEVSTKSVKKYLAAILIVSILWGFIGYVFTQRYIQGSVWASLAVAAILVFVVIHIERQIILSIGKNWWSRVFRVSIGVVMAIIGSVIIDQMLFKEDVEKKKITNIQEEVNKILPFKTQQLDLEIDALDSLILSKEDEKTKIIDEITRTPFVKSSIVENKYHSIKTEGLDGALKDTLIRRPDVTIIDKPNPKAELIPQIDGQIAELRGQKAAKENARLTMRQDLETELKSKTGFLDELMILFSILFSHGVALFVWISLFIFFLAIELFVLVNKFGDHADDYDEVVLYQMRMHKVRLSKLSESCNESLAQTHEDAVKQKDNILTKN